MRKIAYGIALIMFGFYATYVAQTNNIEIVLIAGIILAITGFAIATIGFCNKN